MNPPLKLNTHGGSSVIAHGTDVVFEFWIEGREPAGDTIRISMTPGAALGIIALAARATVAA
ncbi:hypothetical protein [Parvibaculum sp.]|uniref:hypothetical protein n=1 Tax=Parvibaculum sp. TaxID=2024848 RepID=UPI002733BF42|nr:hypothetical protein [Parvibaculum sp.]MDP3328749.1 hypothetical protein [Parvibaculum sp.]